MEKGLLWAAVLALLTLLSVGFSPMYIARCPTKKWDYYLVEGVLTVGIVVIFVHVSENWSLVVGLLSMILGAVVYMVIKNRKTIFKK